MELQLKFDTLFVLGLILTYAIYFALSRILTANTWAHHLLPLGAYIILYFLINWMKEYAKISIDVKLLALLFIITFLAYYFGTYIYVYGRKGGLPGLEFFGIATFLLTYLPFWPIFPALFSAWLAIYLQELRKSS